MRTNNRTRFVWACIALYSALFLVALATSGCGTVKRLTDPQARVSRILQKHPDLVGKLFPTDTLFQRHDSTIYLPGATDTVTLSQMLLDTLHFHHVTILKDSISGLKAEIWRDYANHLRLAITNQPDSLRIQWKDRTITHHYTNTVTEVPDWVKVALGALCALLLLAGIVIFVAIRRKR